MAGLVYTANFGGYDSPKAVACEKGVVYSYCTDGKGAPGGWRHEKHATKNPVFVARNLKVMAPLMWPTYDWYLWLDATMRVKKPLLPLIKKLLDSEHDFAAFKHNEWDCAYREIDACIERKKDEPLSLLKARALLDKEAFPRNFGQAATGVLFRKNTDKVKAHALAWWTDMLVTTMRDQCTFMLNVKNQGGYVEWLPGLHTDNKWFDYRRGHKK